MPQLRNKSSRVVPANRQLSITYLKVDSLKANASNPRVHSEKQVRQIAESIRQFHFCVPVLVDSDLQVIAGHGRLLAARQLGLGEVPTIQLNHLNEAQRQAFLIADNRLTELSSWDDRLLGEQLNILSNAQLEFGLEVLGFETPELDFYIEAASSPADQESDPADNIESSSKGPQVSKLGDCWQLGPHRVICGNALEPSYYRALMRGRKASMTFSDPPYNVKVNGHVSGNGRTRHREFLMASGEMSSEEFRAFLEDSLHNIAANCLSGSLVFLCIDWRHLRELLDAGNAVFEELKNLICWVKSNAGMGSLYRSGHELILVFKKGSGKHRNNVNLGVHRYRTNVWHYPSANSFGRSGREGKLTELHPTVKPIAMVADAIFDCTARGEIILDPFLGSGTTVIAAERTGRVCYGLELDPIYVDTIVRRWQKYTKKSAVHDASGQTFEEKEAGAHVE